MYGHHEFRTIQEHMVKDSKTRVDYLVQMDNIPRVLVEVKSPSVMQNAGQKLPPRGIELSWLAGDPPQVRMLTKVSNAINSPSVTTFKGVCGGRRVSRQAEA
jgi:hypothetical protein